MLKLGRKDPKQSRSKITVDAIFGAVTHILNKDGVAHLTTNKIAEVAGVSVGSLYQYFKNKESIYEGILLRMTEENLIAFENILKTSRPNSVQIKDIIKVVVDNHFQSMQKMDKVAAVLLEYAPKVLSAAHFKKADERIIKFLMNQINEHKIEINPKNKEQAFFVCSQAMRSVLFMSFLNRSAEERELIKNELIQMLTSYLEVKN